MLKSTGKEAKDENGKPIVSSTEFTPEKSDGTVEVTFTFNSTLVQGETLVVFETLLFNDVEYAVHCNINDEGQTVYVPKVGTTATINGKKSIFLASTEVRNITITDKIDYKEKAPIQLTAKAYWGLGLSDERHQKFTMPLLLCFRAF